MADNFLEIFKQLVSDQKYKEFCKKHGKPSDIPEELFEVGYDNFVPYINSQCSQSSCVYDLSTVHDIYSNTYDVSDAFKFNANFCCYFCGHEIKYSDFFTSDDLASDIEEIYKKKAAEIDEETMKRKHTKRGSVLSKLRCKTNNLPAKNAIESFKPPSKKAEESPKKKQGNITVLLPEEIPQKKEAELHTPVVPATTANSLNNCNF